MVGDLSVNNYRLNGIGVLKGRLAYSALYSAGAAACQPA
jgi:hypothetical protein